MKRAMRIAVDAQDETHGNSSSFFRQVYEIVAKIPAGKVATYGQIAAMLGRPRAGRTVGWAMQSAPHDLHLPCHRIVNKAGAMAPAYAFDGADVQRAELEAEGITFRADGCIDMDKHLWNETTDPQQGDSDYLTKDQRARE